MMYSESSIECRGPGGTSGPEGEVWISVKGRGSESISVPVSRAAARNLAQKILEAASSGEFDIRTISSVTEAETYLRELAVRNRAAAIEAKARNNPIEGRDFAKLPEATEHDPICKCIPYELRERFPTLKIAWMGSGYCPLSYDNNGHARGITYGLTERERMWTIEGP